MIDDRKVFTVDVGKLSKNEADKFIGNIVDKIQGQPPGTYYRKNRFNDLVIKISLSTIMILYVAIAVLEYV